MRSAARRPGRRAAGEAGRGLRPRPARLPARCGRLAWATERDGGAPQVPDPARPRTARTRPRVDGRGLHRIRGRRGRHGSEIPAQPRSGGERAGAGSGTHRPAKAQARGLACGARNQPRGVGDRSLRLGEPVGFPCRPGDPCRPRRRHGFLRQHSGADPMNRAPIGIFDSGIGGLTVARAIYERLPRESTIYFGDTARVPYGPKSPETVKRYSLEILHWLLEQGVKAVVVACNTSTAHALRALQEATPVPVLGVIKPGARAAIAAGGEGPVGVIGTAGTITSDAYNRAIQALAPGLRVIQRACSLFVPLVEEGWFDHPATELIAAAYLG